MEDNRLYAPIGFEEFDGVDHEVDNATSGCEEEIEEVGPGGVLAAAEAGPDRRGWGARCREATLTTLTCGAAPIKLRVRSEIAPLVARLVRDLEASRHQPFHRSQSGGYVCRKIAGSTTPSNHSWGLAVDLDWTTNPMLSAAAHRQPHPLRKTFPGGLVLRSDMPADARQLAERYGFRWGGVYRSRPDPMHFEFMGSPADASRRIAELDLPTHRYVVVAGDTLSGIGRKLGVDWKRLAEINGIGGPRYLVRVGQVLRY